MRRLRSRSLGAALALAASMTLTIGLALAQDRPPGDAPKAKAKKDDDKKPKAKPGGKARKGPVAAAGAPPKKNRPDGADPLGQDAKAKKDADPKADAVVKADPAEPPKWPFSFKLKVAGGDGAPIAATYYPPKDRFNAPVILLVHDRGGSRSGKDWREPLDELKGVSLAQSLQEQGYAVLVPDLRGHGANPRHELTENQWRALPADLQATYLFLVDRHNRGDFNLAKFGVVALGEGANLVAAWAAMPGAAVSSEGRVGDIQALILISPAEDSGGLKLLPALAPLAPRVPIYLLCGDRDAPSLKVVKQAQPIVERHQRSKVSYYDTPLHADRLLNFFPKVPGAVTKFLDDPVKARVLEWEPRYLLTPAAYQNEGAAESTAKKSAEPEKKKAEEPAVKKKDGEAKKEDGEAKKKDGE